MRLSSQNSQFVFNLPSDFLPKETIDTYTPILEKNWIQYDNVIDYINSTIKSVGFPGLNINTPEQHVKYGKVRAFKPATNNQDIVSTHELPVTFRSVDADLNYWLLVDIFEKHYLDTEHSFLQPFILTQVDIWRDAIYRINFSELNMIGMSDNKFDYSQQKVNAKEFTVTFRFNFYEIEFLLNKSQVLEVATLPIIIQKI